VASPVSEASEEAKEIVYQALRAGYRMIDCGSFYGNEDLMGAGIARFLATEKRPRSELFLIGKVWNTAVYSGEGAMRTALDKTLHDLQTPYLDLYLLHWPLPGRLVSAWRIMESLFDEGKIKAIGLSNWTIENWEELEAAGFRIRPAVNQIEVNPFLFRAITIQYFQSRGVQIQSYRALAQGKQFDNPTIKELAAKYGKTPSQVLGRFCVQQNITFIPKSTKIERMKENLGVLDWHLDPDEIQQLAELTTEAAKCAHMELYRKCAVRDTPLPLDPNLPATAD